MAVPSPVHGRRQLAAGWLRPSGRNFNPLENTINRVTRSARVAWSTPVSPYGKSSPFVILKGNVYVFDENGTSMGYFADGAPAWHAAAAGVRGHRWHRSRTAALSIPARGGGVVRAGPTCVVPTAAVHHAPVDRGRAPR